jgi:hypothetical protein
VSEPELSARQARVLGIVGEGDGTTTTRVAVSMGRGPEDLAVLEELRSLQALGLIEAQASWSVTPAGSMYLSEREASGDPPGVFDSDHVVAVFERATGVRLELRDSEDFDRQMAHHPVGRLLPRVQLYDSPKEANGQFGGHFTVRISERDDPDSGVRDSGLERRLPEVGPQEYSVSASAERANAEVMFWGDSTEITSEASETWALLTACLHRL